MVTWYGHMMETLRANWYKGDLWLSADDVWYKYDGKNWRKVEDGEESKAGIC